MSTSLQPGDVLLFRPTGYWILNPLVRRIISWGHCAIYYCETKRGLPLIIESIGRGVLIRTLYTYTGTEVRVMRPVCESYGPLAAKAAERLADNPGSWYGYWDIPRFVLPKMIIIKLGVFLPDKIKIIASILAYSYRQNSMYICSELVDQAYSEAGYELYDETMIPLPDDIAESEKLKLVGDFITKEVE